MNPISQTQNFFWNSTVFQLGNLALVDFNIGNDASNPNKGIIVRGGTNSSVEIPILTADNLSSTLSNISTLNVSTINVDTTLSIADLNLSNLSVDQNVSIGGDIVEVGNITSAGNLEFFNISAINEIETDNIIANTATFNGDVNLTTGTMFGNAVGSFANFTSIGGGSIQSTIRIEGPLANISIINASDITAEDLHVSGGILTADNATVFGNTTTATLTCDLTPNLVAGTGITIVSVGGKPTISSLGGGVADPLNISQLNASNISVDLNIDAEDITAINKVEGFLVLGETVQSNGDVICGDDLTVGNNATITRDLQVQRYLDAGKPTFIMLRRTDNVALSSGSIYALFNSNTTAQVNGEFGTSAGTNVVVTTGGWYRVTWALGYVRVANTGGDRAAVRSYVEMNGAFDNSKQTISSSCYLRRSNQCREGHVSGYNFLYIPAGGYVRLRQQCMVEGSTTWNSNLSGLELRGSSNFMVEFVSSAAET